MKKKYLRRFIEIKIKDLSKVFGINSLKDFSFYRGGKERRLYKWGTQRRLINKGALNYKLGIKETHKKMDKIKL